MLRMGFVEDVELILGMKCWENFCIVLFPLSLFLFLFMYHKSVHLAINILELVLLHPYFFY